MVRFQNNLPSVKIPQAFGIAEMTTHLHNGHTPSESDGNPVNYFNSINDPAERRCNAGQSARLQGPALSERLCRLHRSAIDPVGNPTEALGSLWYHDHHLDFTAQNVYKGMFGCYNLFDEQDTGDGPPGCACPAANTTSRSSSMTSCSTRTARRYSTCSTWTAFSATVSARTARSSRT